MSRRTFLAGALFGALAFAAAAQSQGALITNAASGAFPADRQLWFAAPEGQRLRLVVDGVERYRGAGPASLALSAPAGGDQSYLITAERRTPLPEDAILESAEFDVRIDKAPPAPPRLSAVQIEGGWKVSVQRGAGDRVEARLDADGALSAASDLGAETVVAAGRLAALAWTVDAAGNRSAPVSASFEPFNLRIANPAAGDWLNLQRLVLESDGAAYWTDDGSDPLGPGGKPYAGPVLIGKTGAVTLRAGARSADGREIRAEVRFTAKGLEEPDLLPLRRAEEKAVASALQLPVPAVYAWDWANADGRSRAVLAGRGELTLRPSGTLGRAVALEVGDPSGRRRFVFRLGQAAQTAAVGTGQERLPGDQATSPLVVRAAGIRLLVWPKADGAFRYRFGAARDWNPVAGPVDVPAAGGEVEWLLDRGDAVAGPFRAALPAAADALSLPDASVAADALANGPVRLSAAGRDRVFVLSFRPAGAAEAPVYRRTMALAAGTAYDFDVSDGEEGVFSISDDARSFSWRADRRAPAAPSLEAPAEGAWLASAATVRVAAPEGVLEGEFTWTDDAGAGGRLPLVPETILEAPIDGPRYYRLEARSRDAAGNAGPTVHRSFVLDASTVYVSAARAPSVGADGSRGKPFARLDEAIRLAASGGRRRIVVGGAAALGSVVRVSGELAIDGRFDAEWRPGQPGSTVDARTGAIETAPGSRLSIAGLAFTGAGPGAAALLRLGAGSRLEADDCRFGSAGTVLDAVGAEAAFADCLFVSAGTAGNRTAALAANGGSLNLKRCRVEVSVPGGVAVGVSAQNTRVVLDTCVVALKPAQAAFGLYLRGGEAFVAATDVEAVGESYASAVDASGGRLDWDGGSCLVDARDAAAAALENCPAAFAAWRVEISGSGVVRAIQARGVFPEVTGCAFRYRGPSAAAEVFAGAEPAAASIVDNGFAGFALLWSGLFPARELDAFNRRFADRSAPNFRLIGQ
jgi:hypothetical protein